MTKEELKLKCEAAKRITIECHYEHASQSNGYGETITFDRYFVDVSVCDHTYRTFIGTSWFEPMFSLIYPLLVRPETFDFDYGNNPYWTITIENKDGSTISRTEMIGASNMDTMHAISEFIRESLKNQTLWLLDNRRFFYPLITKFDLSFVIKKEESFDVYVVIIDRLKLQLVYEHRIIPIAEGEESTQVCLLIIK